MNESLTNEELDNLGLWHGRGARLRERAVSEIRKMRKVLEKIRDEGCNGPGAYDAVPCKGYVKKKDWRGPCLASAALN